MLKIIFATHNKNKLKEVQSMFPEQAKIVGLEEVGCFEEIPETGNTLQANALEKARHVHRNYSQNCFADDTGLEIDALGGKPGVFSARYAGADKNSLDNMHKVLREMHSQPSRKARFRTVIALILDGEEMLFEGVSEGEIIPEMRGAEGFGYDPIFIPEGYNQTYAEMPLEEKNKISHRYKAIKMFADYLMSLNYY